MAVKEVSSVKDIPKNPEEYDFDPDTSKIPVKNKTRVGGPRMVLVEDTGEDEEVPQHSGVIENGVHIYDKSPVPGGRIMTATGKLINSKGREIDSKGNIVDPQQYAEEDNATFGR